MHNPQLHHIDENPSNSVAENLLPLCPNCHLQDLHDPTGAPDPLKIKLFRRTKDPFVLDSRFDPIWKRIRFLTPGRDETDEAWGYSVTLLLRFIESFNMGAYYRDRIYTILDAPFDHFQFYRKRDGLPCNMDDFPSEGDYDFAVQSYRAQAVEDLCVEMLRYQGWTLNKQPDPR